MLQMSNQQEFDYGISLTRSYGVRIGLPNGQTITLEEPLSNTSAPYAFEVGEIQTLVTNVG